MRSLHEQRRSRHMEGVEKMQRGAYKEAFAIMNSALSEFGPHVGLLSDMAIVSYLGGDIGLFTLLTEKLESEFHFARERLDTRSRVLTLVALAKSYEELARLADAWDAIEEAEKEAPAGDRIALRVACQKLRLLASFGREAEVAMLYQKCLSVSESTPQLLIECFHALLLAETRLFGLNHAWPRLLALTQNKDLQAADLRLAAIDLLEVAFDKRDLVARERLLKFIREQALDGLDAYETKVVDLAGHSHDISADDLFEWPRIMTPLGVMRLIGMAINNGVSAENRETLRGRMNFLIQSQNHRTQKILLKKWSAVLARETQLSIQLDKKAQSLRAANGELALRASPLSWALLESLSEGETEPAKLLRRLNKCGDSAHNLESVRIALLRLNRKVAGFLGVDWAFKFRKNQVVINERIRMAAV